MENQKKKIKSQINPQTHTHPHANKKKKPTPIRHQCFSLTGLTIFSAVKNAVLYDPGYNSVISYLNSTEMLF